MADLSLKAYLKDWFRAHHFYMMPPAKRAQWLDIMGEDDYDVVNEDTQATFRDLMESATPLAPPAYVKDVTLHAGNIDRVRTLSGMTDFDSHYKIGDKYPFNVTTAAARDQYLRVFSPKLGDRFYYNDVRSGAQKNWGDKKSGTLLDRPYPDISEMKPEEIERFYTIVRTTLRNIKDNAPEYTDPDNPEKVDNFLGPGKAFEEFAIAAGGNADVRLKQFAKMADRDPILTETLRNHLVSRFGADYTVDTFIADLQEPKIRARALNRVPTFMATLKEWNSAYSTVDASIKNKVASVFNDTVAFDAVITETNQESETIDPIKLAQFKNPRVYAELLSALYDTSKEGKKSAFYDKFAAQGGDQITKPMTLVVENFNYDKLDGKYKDKLSFYQQLKKDIEDWGEDHITKLWKRNLRHNYIEPNAKGVVDAICKLEINPEDGLEKILKKKADIKKLLTQKSPASEKGFDFLCEVLEKIQDPMKKAFAGALKNGKQAEAVAKEIIKAATAHQPPKIADAKVALETLAVMRYDILSAARGEKMNKALMGAKFFDGASFMKNDAVKFIINAAQRGLNLGMCGAFWATVMGRNLIQHARGKISQADIDALSSSMDKIQTNANKFATLESSQTELDTAKANYAAFEATHDAAITAAGFPVGTADRLKKYMDKQQDDLYADEDEFNTKRQELDDNRPRNLAMYAGLEAEAHAWNAAVTAGAPTPGLTHEFIRAYNVWSADVIAVDDDPEHLIPLFETYLHDKATGLGLTPAARAVRLSDLLTRSRDIRVRKANLDALRPQYNQLQAELNVAQDVFNYQKKKHNERAEKRTEHDAQDAPINDLENAQVLAHFWNACNGYDFGLDINDYNFLKKHDKNNSQKLAFNAVVRDRL